MAYINLTRQTIHVYPMNAFQGLIELNGNWIADSVDPEQSLLVVESSGNALIAVETMPVATDDNIILVKTSYGEATGIPENVQWDDLLIVSVAFQSMARASGHPLIGQMVVPYQVVRLAVDGKSSGTVLGCMGFSY